jgi:hypothetical protein
MSDEGFTFITIGCDALPEPHAFSGCPNCTTVAGYIARYVKTNGTVSLRWVCDWCATYSTTDLPRRLIGDTPLAQIPKRIDVSDTLTEWNECEICEGVAEDFHHWAPRSIFPDWPSDVGVHLCTLHHNEWHNTMKAHGLKWPHELAGAV